MVWRRRFQKPSEAEQPVRSASSTPQVTTLPIPIAQPRPFQVFPGSSDDPLDAEVAALWRQFQSKQMFPAWDAFVKSMADDVATLDAEIEKLRRQIAELGPAADVDA